MRDCVSDNRSFKLKHLPGVFAATFAVYISFGLVVIEKYLMVKEQGIILYQKNGFLEGQWCCVLLRLKP